MKLRLALLAAIAFCGAGLPLTADAATVSRESGEVLINDGSGFVALSTPAELGAGTQVMVRPGGTALIAYSGDCVLRVGAGRVWTVQSSPPCAPGRQVDMTGRMNQQSEGGGPGIDGTTLLVGAAVVGGGVAAALLIGGNNDDSKYVGPASP